MLSWIESCEIKGIKYGQEWVNQNFFGKLEYMINYGY